MNEPLIPFTLGEILDRTAQLYRSNFLLFAGVAAAPTGVMVGVFACGGALLGVLGVAARSAMPTTAMTGLLVLCLLLIGLPVGIAATVVSHAGLTRAAINAHMGQALTIRGTFKSVGPRFWRYVLVLILQFTFVVLIPAVAAGAIIGGFAFFASRAGGGTAESVAFGILAFFLFLGTLVYIVRRALEYSMAMAVCVVEDKTAFASLSRSAKLAAGTRGRIFVMALLVWAISIALSMITYIPMLIVVGAASAAGGGTQYGAVVTVVAEVLQVVSNFVLQTLVMPVYMTALVLFYYDQRIRTEGYDIELLMEQAGLIGTVAAATAELPVSADAAGGL